MSSNPHCLANIVFFSREHGGRFTPPESGFHPQIQIGEEYTSCKIDRIGYEKTFSFNMLVKVNLTLLLPEIYFQRLYEGLSFEIFEGAHHIGSGTVLKLFKLSD